MTVICHFTRFAQAHPTKAATGAEAARVLIDHIFTVFGLPRIILSDRGSHFTSKMMSAFYGLFGIEKIQTTAYHPQGNGIIERVHRSLNYSLTHLVQDKKCRDWDDKLKLAMYSYCISDCRAIGISPFEALFGRNPREPTDLLYGPSGAFSRFEKEYGINLPLRLQEVHAKMRNFEKIYQQKRFIEESKGRRFVTFLVGTKVMLHVPSYLKDSIGRQLALPIRLLFTWRGPYTIIEVLFDNVYRLSDLPHGSNTVNGSRLLPISTFQSVLEQRIAETASQNISYLDSRSNSQVVALMMNTSVQNVELELLPMFGDNLQKRLSALNAHISKLQTRLNLPPMTTRFDQIDVAELRVLDLSDHADYILRFNEFFDHHHFVFQNPNVERVSPMATNVQFNYAFPNPPVFVRLPNLPLPLPPTQWCEEQESLKSVEINSQAPVLSSSAKSSPTITRYGRISKIPSRL